MSKVSSKYQITLPRALARSHRISPGEEVVFEEVGSALYLRRGGQRSDAAKVSVLERVDSFDQASQRQESRNRAVSGALKPTQDLDRGWTRDELYQRG